MALPVEISQLILRKTADDIRDSVSYLLVLQTGLYSHRALRLTGCPSDKSCCILLAVFVVSGPARSPKISPSTVPTEYRFPLVDSGRIAGCRIRGSAPET